MSANLTDRYSRQTLLHEIGQEGQKKLTDAAALVIGCGALGSTIAELLARAGIGRIKVVDRDIIELSNLHRQILYDEADANAQTPKAEAAAVRLRKINSAITVECAPIDVTVRNIESLLEGFDVVIDGTDNVETRYLVNDACVKHGIPWIYGGAVGTSGVLMSVVPQKGPCLRCIFPDPPPPGTLPTCETAGVLGATPVVIGAMQSARAIKLLVGDFSDIDEIFSLDIWHGSHSGVSLPRRDDCPACGERSFEFLSKKKTAWVTTLCGRNAVQVTPPADTKIDLAALTEKLEVVAATKYNGITLEAELDNHNVVIFPDGRVIVKGTTIETYARGLISKFLGW